METYINYFNHKHINFCCELVKKTLDFKQSTSSLIFVYLKSHGKEFGSHERKLIADIVFFIVKNTSYFRSIINEEKKNIHDLNELRCLVIMGAMNKLEKKIY